MDKNALLLAASSLIPEDMSGTAFEKIHQTLEKYNMTDMIRGGVAVGFSGGSDSVLLLIFLWNLRKRYKFRLKAIHVNHMIRGNDADADEEFCREFCHSLAIDFYSERIDVPALAARQKLGMEEAARGARYELFEKIVKSEGFSSLATAHNATDNLETFIFNLMRGTGLTGLCGIAPVRGYIIRPIIALSKESILKLLTDANIPFVTDKTNFSCEYTRNYIRHEILPKLSHLSTSPESACTKATDALRTDDDFLSSEALCVFRENFKDGIISAEVLLSIHPAVFVRVLRLLVGSVSEFYPERVHIDKIRELLIKGNSFEVALPGDISFYKRSDNCFIAKTKKGEASKFSPVVLKEGFNEIPELNIAISVTDEKIKDFSSNVYKIAIQADIKSAIICDELFVRTRSEGDMYYYGNMTRKVKKLFCDKKIPAEKRDKIPVICDGRGIVFIPGFGVRDDLSRTDGKIENNHKWITVYEKI